MDDAEGDCPGTEAVRRGLIEVQKQLAELEEKAYRDAHVWGQHTTIAVQHGHDEDAALAAEEGQACVAVALILELAREILGERLAKGSRMEELLARRVPVRRKAAPPAPPAPRATRPRTKRKAA